MPDHEVGFARFFTSHLPGGHFVGKGGPVGEGGRGNGNVEAQTLGQWLAGLLPPDEEGGDDVFNALSLERIGQVESPRFAHRIDGWVIARVAFGVADHVVDCGLLGGCVRQTGTADIWAEAGQGRRRVLATSSTEHQKSGHHREAHAPEVDQIRALGRAILSDADAADRDVEGPCRCPASYRDRWKGGGALFVTRDGAAKVLVDRVGEVVQLVARNEVPGVPPEAQLVRAIVETDDRRAKELLYRRLAPGVFGLVHRLLGGIDVDDVVQDTFIDAFQQLDQLREPGAVVGWVRGIAVNRVRRVIRKRALLRRLGFSSAPLEPEEIVGQHADPESRAELVLLFKLLDRIPGEARIALILRRVEGLTVPEIGEAMGLSDSTVKRRIREGLEVVSVRERGKGQ